MKYFTNDLWRKINSSNKSERDTASLTWKNNIKAYKAELKKIAKKIPRDTMNAITQITEGDVILHDSTFKCITFSSVESPEKPSRLRQLYKRVCCLQLTDGEMNIELIMSDVKKVLIEVEYWKEDNIFEMQWGYCEFSYKRPNVVLSILWDKGHVWQFEFSSLSIKCIESASTQ